MNHPEMARATEALKTLSEDPAARELARQRRLAELDYQTGLSEAEARGEAKGLREAIRHLCQVFGIELDSAREERLARGKTQELVELHEAIASQRSWPES